MSEYIITEKQLKTATEAYMEREIPLPFTEVYVSGDKLPEIVRCRDCKHYTDDEMEYYHYCSSWCEQVTPDGFCSWGERKVVDPTKNVVGEEVDA